jgi:hypothetical protein
VLDACTQLDGAHCVLTRTGLIQGLHNVTLNALCGRSCTTVLRICSAIPPVPSGSRYRRTGDLGRGWRPNVQITLSEISGYLWNSATDRKSGREYMTYVQGPWQTLMHQQTGWTTISDVRAARAQQYRADLQAIYSRHIRKGP